MPNCCHEMGNHADDAPKNQTDTYTCPMHPKVLQDKPGNCPECGMNLVPFKQKGDGLLGRLFSSHSK
jgi:hypothetical protein